MLEEELVPLIMGGITAPLLELTEAVELPGAVASPLED